MENQDCIKFALDVIKIFISTFFGAFIAFQVQKHQNKKKTEEQKYSSLFRAQASLISMRNILINIKGKYPLELFDKNEYYKIQKLVFKTTYPIPDYKEILLALKKKDIQQLFRIENSEQRFINTINTIHERNSTYDKFTSIVSDIGLESTLWKPISSDLQSLTTPIPQLINDAEKCLIEMIESLCVLIKEYYPNKNALLLTDKIEIKEYN